MELNELIRLSVKHNASDLHLCCGDFPHWRRLGNIEIIPDTVVIDESWFRQFNSLWLSDKLEQQLHNTGHCEFAMALPFTNRIRAALFTTQRGLSLALRVINSTAIALDTLDLPAELFALVSRQQGLLLLTGATGAGKSTTLTALLDYINHRQQRHIIMLEDPIEYCHHNQQCLIQQREIGAGLMDFEAGIRSALRQDPDIIVIGELRDKRAVQLALIAAETGHLVLATLHSADSAQTLQRLADVFPQGERDTIRSQLAQSLIAILSQRLCYQTTQAVALFELLINNSAIANLIRDGRNHQLHAQIELATQEGMLSFRQSQLQRIAAGRLTVAEPIKKGFQTNFQE